MGNRWPAQKGNKTQPNIQILREQLLCTIEKNSILRHKIDWCRCVRLLTRLIQNMASQGFLCLRNIFLVPFFLSCCSDLHKICSCFLRQALQAEGSYLLCRRWSLCYERMSLQLCHRFIGVQASGVQHSDQENAQNRSNHVHGGAHLQDYQKSALSQEAIFYRNHSIIIVAVPRQRIQFRKILSISLQIMRSGKMLYLLIKA